MILQRGTYKAFGYYPSKVNNKAIILHACNACGDTRVITKGTAVKFSYGGKCKKCSSKENQRLLAGALRKNAEKKPGQEITDQIICDVMMCGSVENRRTSNTKTIQFSSKQRFKRIRLNVNESYRFYEKIGIRTKSPTTKEVKDACCKYLINSQDLAFKTITYIFNKYRKLCPHNNSGFIVSDSNGYIWKIFDRLDFRYTIYSSNRVGMKIAKVKNGSFYINGRWIHI